MDNPFQVFDSLRQTYLRYLDSPFRLRYPALLQERRTLLDQDRQLYRLPLVEAIPPYESSPYTVPQACAQFGIDAAVADFISRGFFQAHLPLHQHQFEAWQRSRNGRAVVVTSGTGSGKTECYLLPIFAYLAEELLTGWSAEPSARQAALVEISTTRQNLTAHKRNRRPSEGGSSAFAVSLERAN